MPPPLVPLVHPWIDAARAPLYGITFPAAATDEELQLFCQAREDWARVAKYRVAWVVDLAGLIKATATQRRIFGEHLKRFEPHDVAYNQGSALIVPNPFVRGVVTAVFWLKAPRFPSECFSTREAALAWASARLAQRPSAVPPATR
jgi:hypothetical protein